MSIFGWSYPPGCSGLPDDDEGPCDRCGENLQNCQCPECPVCSNVGCVDHLSQEEAAKLIKELRMWKTCNWGRVEMALKLENEAIKKEIDDEGLMR